MKRRSPQDKSWRGQRRFQGVSDRYKGGLFLSAVHRGPLMLRLQFAQRAQTSLRSHRLVSIAPSANGNQPTAPCTVSVRFVTAQWLAKTSS